MTLKQYILTEDLQQEKKLIKKLERLNSVQEAKYDKDFEVYDETGGFSIILKTTNGDDYILRILDTKEYKEPDVNWEQFIEHNYNNIVEVVFYKEINDYYVVLMEKLEPLNSDERAFIRNLSLIFQLVLKKPIPLYLNEEYITLYEAIEIEVNEVLDKANDFMVPKVLEVIENYEEYKNMIEDINQMLKDYERETGSPYRDFHEGNILKDKQGNYKLIDL